MKRFLIIVLFLSIIFAGINNSNAESFFKTEAYSLDSFSDRSNGGTRIVYEFITSKKLTPESNSTGEIHVVLKVYTNGTMQKLGFSSMKVQRWNRTSWVTDAEETDQYSLSTDYFNYSHTFTGLYSGAMYRVKVSLRARRVPGEVQDMTITSDNIICH